MIKMKPISLKLKDEIFYEVEEVTKKRNIPRNMYINEAVEFYNRIQKREMLKEQLRRESKLVRESSLEVLEEFEKLQDDYVGKD